MRHASSISTSRYGTSGLVEYAASERLGGVVVGTELWHQDKWRGSAINTNTPRSTDTRSLKCSAGLGRIAWSTCEPIQARSSGRTRPTSPATDNWLPEGWLAQLGWIRRLGREGGLFFTIGRRS